MATLKYIGTFAQWDSQPGFGNDPVTLSYLNLLLSLNMTMPQALAQISSLLTPYATASYATSAMTGLATPAFTNAQVANYVPATTVNQANGPAGLGSASGQVASGQIDAPSTQQWPSPFWSPSSYQLPTGQTWPITATTVPQTLYTVAITDPGYIYTLACFGLMDCQVAADNQAYPQVLVRQGSTTGPIVAFGYGLAESYQGPAPGTVASQAFLNSGTVATATWSTVSGWSATNNSSFTTTMLGNFMSIPVTSIATLSASMTFSGADGAGLRTPSTLIRIINNAGTVLATGTAVTGASGTCTVSFTGQFTAGQLYAVQAEETNIIVGTSHGTFGTFSTGTFTLTPNQIPNTAMVSIIPAPFEGQTPLTGPTTLYVMLASSDATTQVSASTFDPSLWVMPIPWA